MSANSIEIRISQRSTMKNSSGQWILFFAASQKDYPINTSLCNNSCPNKEQPQFVRIGNIWNRLNDDVWHVMIDITFLEKRHVYVIIISNVVSNWHNKCSESRDHKTQTFNLWNYIFISILSSTCPFRKYILILELHQ